MRGVKRFLCGPAGCCAITEDIDKDCTYEKFEEVDNSSCLSGCSKHANMVKSPRTFRSRSETELADFTAGTDKDPLYTLDAARLEISCMNDYSPHRRLGIDHLPDLALSCCKPACYTHSSRTSDCVLGENEMKHHKYSNGHVLSIVATEAQKQDVDRYNCSSPRATTSCAARTDGGDPCQPGQLEEVRSLDSICGCYDSCDDLSLTLSHDSGTHKTYRDDAMTVDAVNTRRSRSLSEMFRQLTTVKSWSPRLNLFRTETGRYGKNGKKKRHNSQDSSTCTDELLGV